jgi:hypothetical protein
VGHGILLSDSIIHCQNANPKHLSNSSRESCNFSAVRPNWLRILIFIHVSCRLFLEGAQTLSLALEATAIASNAF